MSFPQGPSSDRYGAAPWAKRKAGSWKSKPMSKEEKKEAFFRNMERYKASDTKKTVVLKSGRPLDLDFGSATVQPSISVRDRQRLALARARAFQNAEGVGIEQGGVPSLFSLAAKVAALHSDDGVAFRTFFFDLDNDSWSCLPVSCMVNLLEESVKVAGKTLPFDLWVKSNHVFGPELPKRYRTFRGLSLQDTKELDSLHPGSFEDNREKGKILDHRRLLGYPPIPTCILTAIDLSNTPADDEDIFTMRDQCPFAVLLKLDGSKVTGAGIARLATGAGTVVGFVKAWEKLKVLSLKKLNVIDRDVKGLYKFKSLQMLDLRGTSCTAAARTIIANASASSLPSTVPSFRPAKTVPEKTLFAVQLSISNLLAHLANLEQEVREVPIENQKPHLAIVNRVFPHDPQTGFGPSSSTQTTVKAEGGTSHPSFGTVYSTGRGMNLEILRGDGDGLGDPGRAFKTSNEETLNAADAPQKRKAEIWARSNPVSKWEWSDNEDEDTGQGGGGMAAVSDNGQQQGGKESQQPGAMASPVSQTEADVTIPTVPKTKPQVRTNRNAPAQPLAKEDVVVPHVSNPDLMLLRPIVEPVAFHTTGGVASVDKKPTMKEQVRLKSKKRPLEGTSPTTATVGGLFNILPGSSAKKMKTDPQSDEHVWRPLRARGPAVPNMTPGPTSAGLIRPKMSALDARKMLSGSGAERPKVRPSIVASHVNRPIGNVVQRPASKPNANPWWTVGVKKPAR